MKTFLILVLLAFCNMECLSANADTSVVGPDTLLLQESDLSTLPYLSHNISYLQSSYDRSGGNSDFGNFLSTTNNLAVLADIKGPGAVVRIWSANPLGTIKVYIDDNPVPVINMPFASMFDNSTPPFVSPIAGQSSGGFYSYLPITFARHCVITTEVLSDYYQVNYVSFPQGTAVRPFALPLPQADQVALTEANSVWSSLAISPTFSGLEPPTTIESLATSTLGKYAGSGVVTRIRLSVPGTSDSELRNLVLRAYFDGHRSADVEAPVSDFFGNAYGRTPFRSLLLAQSLDGSFEADFPMPFAKTAVFTLENGLGRPVQAAWSADVVRAPFRKKSEGYFHALWHSEQTSVGHPHVYASVQGQRGKLVGIVLTVNSPRGFEFIEGDDQIRVDNQTWTPTPQNRTTEIGPWNGTGTEDSFNSGWAFSTGVNFLPMNGLLFKADTGQVDCYRWYFDDAPIFQSSLDAQIEHGEVNNTSGEYYSSVAYFYSTGPMRESAPFPKAADLTAPIPKLMNFKIPNAIEGESLPGVATAGHVGVQNMIGFGDTWSNDAQLIWGGGSAGDTLTLSFSPQSAGAYDLVVYLTKARDYGQVNFQVNGQKVGSTFDGYNPSVIPSGPVDLGLVNLPAGQSTLLVSIIGKNPASTNTIFGLDVLCLNPPGTKPFVLPAE